ncbi:ATP-dependent DNA ligase [Polychytrium aggregatum]|uniref:ATP-dependent DNA ligase n=1 Tax=Polychytrium aggregatum TaxID=110093 RepID=UPI0022FE4251|nr:ATP-dependent DNA ligase [Polychytrium aggregatum]KAI9209046.1 ATP-dependent DNA ligase [Polychytrium aggregatum]
MTQTPTAMAQRMPTATTSRSPRNRVPYAALCETFVQIEATTKRLEITDILTKFFQRVISLSPSNLTQCIYLCINRIGPEYEGRELHVGDSILMKAVVEATGRNLQALKADVVEHGDLGTVAEQSRGKQRTLATPQPLTVPQVFDTLKTISEITGTSSQKRKIDLIRKMLVACRENEAKYIIRSLAGTLRIGLAEQTVLQSLARAFVLNDSETRKMSKDKLENELASATAIVKQVYTELPTYDQIVPALLEHGVHHLPEHCKLTPGIPLKPMLAHPTKSLTEVLDRFENMTFSCEYKYDGERAQIHRLEDGSVMIFSRNSENLSVKYPDIIARVPAISKPDVTSFVLDCEAVAWDREKKCILPFQVLSTRKKKDVTAEEVKIQVCVFVFDLLYFNGKPVTGEPLKTRRQLLEENFIEIEGGFHFSKSMESSNVEEIQTFLNEAIVGNCEGLMVKTLEKEASYEPSKRSRNWLKVKKDYLSGLGDSLDLVVIGGWYGRGKRTGTYGAYLLACYDEDREEYQSICKMGTGFDDESLAGHYKFLSEHTIEAPKNYYNISDNPNVRPDVWFDAVQVWEVKCADLSISPVHRAAMGLVAEDKGISLRFPRFIRIRDDKGPSDATSAAQVAEMYQSQNINPVHGNKSRDDDF